MKNKFIMAVMAFTMCGMLVACGSSSGDTAVSETATSTEVQKEETAEPEKEEVEPTSEPEDAEEIEEASEAEEEAESVEDEAPEEEESATTSDEGDLGDYHVKINDATFGEDYEGNPMIVIHYDFTNNSDEAQSALWSLSSKAYQDGIELDTAIALDDDMYDAGISQKEIKPGVTIEDCQEAYTLTSDSPVEFEMSELISFSDEKLEKTFEVK
ncbi:DUF5067 domain-containing protein [Butyrivibrio sp. MC2013]|uniref:DUF5067 domain-containing protein n=1 Tax=Butyrivibrio sp. MC2013 TaxID=1280686 RepID=UPI0003F5013B|nr:DUF5067 domain-containing protein [Butyrivibrio sp. MC2013]